MTFTQKICKALPHLSARELWFIEVDYDHTRRSAAKLEMCAVARSCASMVETIQKERLKRFPDSRCPFPARLRVDGIFHRARNLTHYISASSAAHLPRRRGRGCRNETGN